MTHAPPLPDLSQLSDPEKDALIVALWTQLDAALAANAELMAKVAALTARVAELEAKLNEPPKFTNEVQHRYKPELRWARDMTSSILMIVELLPGNRTVT